MEDARIRRLLSWSWWALTHSSWNGVAHMWSWVFSYMMRIVRNMQGRSRPIQSDSLGRHATRICTWIKQHDLKKRISCLTCTHFWCCRLLEVDFSEPLSNCLSKVGSFHVNYTISTGSVSQLRVTREVMVEDIDMCSSPADIECEACRVRCHPLARCVNEKGSYGCECPSCTSGDGFLPTKFQEGTTPLVRTLPWLSLFPFL